MCLVVVPVLCYINRGMSLIEIIGEFMLSHCNPLSQWHGAGISTPLHRRGPGPHPASSAVELSSLTSL
jgi:hypothetical protein